MKNITALPDLVIGDININPPIIQGGMGVLVSGANLASAVSNEGALGVLAAVGCGEDYADKGMNYTERSSEGLRQMIRRTRAKTSNPIAVNIMCALTNYDELVRTATDENISVIISGAGLPLKLPSLVTNNTTKLIPVVSSSRAVELICRTWFRRNKRLPDAIIVEGSSAGGHLGFSPESIGEPSHDLKTILREVLEVTGKYKTECNTAIPIIVAGGIFDGKDIAEFLNLGASGVQMGTRFVCTDECDASIEYKKAYIECKEEDIAIVKSPVKLPLRVIKNSFIEHIMNGKKHKFSCNYHCLQTCEPAKSLYCIADALKNASRGNMDIGFATCGANAYRIKSIVSVRELINELVDECIRFMPVPSAIPRA